MKIRKDLFTIFLIDPLFDFGKNKWKQKVKIVWKLTIVRKANTKWCDILFDCINFGQI